MARSTGTAAFGFDQYVADIQPPGLLYAALARSTKAYAQLEKVDLAGALSTPGVLAAVDGAVFHRKVGMIPTSRDEPPLALDVVRYVGEPVAAVVAVTPEAARHGADRVRILYRSLPFIPDIQASATGATTIHASMPDNILRDVRLSFGPVDECFSSAQRIVSGSYSYAGSTHAAMETHGAVAWWRPEQRLWIWSSTQSPFHLQHNLACALDLDPAAVRVLKPKVGGGFGGKCETFSHEIVTAQLSKMLNRPVRLILTREEVFYTHRGRHHALMDLRLALGSNHEILAIDADISLDGGAYAGLGVVTTHYAGQLLAIPYKLKALRFRSRRYFTNAPPAGPKRGHGSVQIRFAMERLIDKAAVSLGIDPLVWRRELALAPGASTVNELKIGSTGFGACLDRVAGASGWFDSSVEGEALGVAGSAYISGAAFPIFPNRLPHSQAMLRADRSGLFTLYTGVAEIGQGTEHAMAQLAAETLGQERHRVTVLAGDTDACPVDLGSYSSRVTLMAGKSVIAAAQEVRKQLLRAASARLKIPVEELDIIPGRIVSKADEGRGLSLKKAIALAEEQAGLVLGTGHYRPDMKPAHYKGSALGPSPAYSFSAAVARVSVDKELGLIRVLDLWLAHDCGTAIDRKSVLAQLYGCAIMGYGEALLESTGLVGSVTDPVALIDYGVPLVGDLPRIHPLIVEAPDPEGPRGAKEVGEGPLLPVIPAIANAASRALGVDLDSIPLFPDMVLEMYSP